MVANLWRAEEEGARQAKGLMKQFADENPGVEE